MKVFRGLPNAASRAPCALAIGNFDGVHSGHQALLAHVRQAADRLGVEAAVMTFEPHPREFFATQQGRPELAPARIATLRDKLESLGAAGIDRVIVEHFNSAFAALSPQDFIDRILVQGLHTRWLMVGQDFCFGRQRSGNIDTLMLAGQQSGFTVETLPNVNFDGQRVSSSAVRAALADGDMARAARWLGHPYQITGHVLHGKKLGRTIGFPTLNMRMPKRPALSGIFIVEVHGLADQPVPGVASIGTRPTVDDSGRVLLETHLFDFNADCYGKLVQVEFLARLRDEEKYIDLPTLVNAIERDAHNARLFFAQRTAQARSATDRI